MAMKNTKKNDIFSLQWHVETLFSPSGSANVHICFETHPAFFDDVSVAQGILKSLPIIKNQIELSIHKEEQLAKKEADRKLKEAIALLVCHHPGVAWCNACKRKK